MTSPRFVQIHFLTSYPAALLNRDDAGLAKRLPFGGVTRTRISSQCLKRHWRMAEDEQWDLRSIGVPMAVRSRRIVDRALVGWLIDEQRIDTSTAQAVGEAFLKQLFQESAARKRATDGTEEIELETGQAVLFGEPEIAWLREQALACCSGADDPKAAKAAAEALFKDTDVKANLAAMKHHAGLESALFGRMVTSDLIANTEAAIHVAHAFTVHEEESESDYFTVVDDLKDRAGGDDAGSAGIFDMELTSGLYYGYVVVDVPGLVANLGGDAALAGRVVEHLIHLVATVSPGAKLGSTAPYGWAQLLLIEKGSRQPRTLANAFRDPVPLDRRGGTLEAAVKVMGQHLSRLDEAYGAMEQRRFLAVEPGELSGAKRGSLGHLATWARAEVAGGTVAK
jgi:CRISPR system Cascade subunit CasC